MCVCVCLCVCVCVCVPVCVSDASVEEAQRLRQEQLLGEALQLCPRNFTARLRLAALLHERGNADEVARLLAQAGASLLSSNLLLI